MDRSFSNIALIGMMGSGKTVVGKKLADRLGWHLVDTDAMIVAEQGRPISEIFAQDGEEAFRRMEAEAVRKATAAEQSVIATGGGAVLRPENRENLWARCWVVWLRATPEEHVARTERGGGRPVLDRHQDRLAAVQRLLDERGALYALADTSEDTTGRDLESIVDSLLPRWNAQKSR